MSGRSLLSSRASRSTRPPSPPMSITRPTSDDVAADLSPVELDAWRGLLRVHAWVLKALASELEGAHGLPLTSYEVLAQLAAAPERRMRMCDLADSVLLSRSGMSRLVDRLVRDGLIERCACAQDARGAFACITPAGFELLEAARPAHLEGIRQRFLAHFGEGELAQLGGFWQRLLP